MVLGSIIQAGEMVKSPITNRDILNQIHDVTTKSLEGLLIAPATVADFLFKHIDHVNGAGGWGDKFVLHFVEGVISYVVSVG
jgi:hypothetical protein